MNILLLLAAERPTSGLFDGVHSDDDATRILGSSLGPDDISPEKQCEAAIFEYTSLCPGFESIDIVSANVTDVEALRRFCPCVSHAARNANADAFHAMARTCGRSFATSISYLSNVVCAMPPSKATYCSAKVAEINVVFGDITKILNGSKNALSAENRATMQRMLEALCDPCFDEISVGLVRWMAESNAAGRAAPAEPTDGPSEITQVIGKLLDSRVLCARNDNATQTRSGEAFCVPWLLGEMLPLGSRCVDVQPKRAGPPTVAAQQECLLDDECVWYSGNACGSLVDHFTDASTYAHLPPAAIHASTATNACFLTVQNVIQQNRAILGDAVVPGQAPAATRADMEKASKALNAVSAYGWLGAANATVADSCLARWRASDFTAVHEACSEAEIESVRSASPTFSRKCAAPWKRLVSRLGCCFGALREVQEAFDPEHRMLPNFAGASAAAGAQSVEACAALSGEPRKVAFDANGITCADMRSADEAALMGAFRGDAAAFLGVPVEAVGNLSVTNADGNSCGKAANDEEGRNVRVSCSVRLSDAARLERVAASVANSPVVLPSVHYIVHKDREVEKRLRMLKSQRTKTDSAISYRVYMSYKLWAISMCCVVFLLVVAIFVILVWREKVTFVWCWSCQALLRKTRRAKPVKEGGRKSVKG